MVVKSLYLCSLHRRHLVNIAKYSGRTFSLVVFPWAAEPETEQTTDVSCNSSPLVNVESVNDVYYMFVTCGNSCE